MAAVELKMSFRDTYVEGGEDLEFIHTLSAPEGMEITGGQIFVERPSTGEFERFSFRIDREDGDRPKLTIMEDIKT